MTALAAGCGLSSRSADDYAASRQVWLLLAALAFGVLVLPFLVYLTGRTCSGRYAAGGALGFFGDFLRGLRDVALARVVARARAAR